MKSGFITPCRLYESNISFEKSEQLGNVMCPVLCPDVGFEGRNFSLSTAPSGLRNKNCINPHRVYVMEQGILTH